VFLLPLDLTRGRTLANTHKEIGEAHKKRDEEKANQARVQPSEDKSSPGEAIPRNDAARLLPGGKGGLFAVVADGVLRADGGGVFSRRQFLLAFGLLEEIDVRFVVVVFQQLWRFVEAHAAGRAGVIDVP
jgi:hypothetical protein